MTVKTEYIQIILFPNIPIYIPTFHHKFQLMVF